MWLFRLIQRYFFKTALSRELARIGEQPREIMNLEDAKTVTILFNATKTEDVITVTQFADSIKNMGKQVEMLGFENKNPKKETPEQEHTFDKRSVNWFGKPHGEKISAFKKNKPDILICAFEKESLPLEYLAAVSLAKFRVGKYTENNIAHFELMINTQTNQTLQYLLTQITHFLKVINKSNG